MLDEYKGLRKNLLLGIEELRNFTLNRGNLRAAESLAEISQKIRENRSRKYPALRFQTLSCFEWE